MVLNVFLLFCGYFDWTNFKLRSLKIVGYRSNASRKFHGHALQFIQFHDFLFFKFWFYFYFIFCFVFKFRIHSARNFFLYQRESPNVYLSWRYSLFCLLMCSYYLLVYSFLVGLFARFSLYYIFYCIILFIEM